MRKGEQRVQYVGGSDEETALLRLLLRKGRDRLQADWRLDEDASAPDLVVLDPATMAGDAAALESRNGGRPFVCVVDADAPDSGDWQLRRPLKLDAVVRVFNALTPSAEPGSRVLSQGEDFFLVDLEDGSSGTLLDAEALDSIPTGAVRAGRDRDDYRWEAEADALFRRDPSASELDGLASIKLDNTSYERVERTTSRSEARMQEGDTRTGRVTGDDGARALKPGERGREDSRVLPLIDYLETDILGGPARTRHGGLHSLVLDPKHRSFHAEADLEDLELYCLQGIPVSSFVALTTPEIEAVQASQPARPYVKLKWLYHLINSNGRLASHLDPGGRYRLAKFLELATDYPQQFRIASKLASPRKVHEIAEQAGVRIEAVYDVLNAFDAIGYLEWELRDRLRGIMPADGATGTVPEPRFVRTNAAIEAIRAREAAEAEQKAAHERARAEREAAEAEDAADDADTPSTPPDRPSR